MSNTQFGRKTIRLSGQGMICSNSAMRKENQIYPTSLATIARHYFPARRTRRRLSTTLRRRSPLWRAVSSRLCRRSRRSSCISCPVGCCGSAPAIPVAGSGNFGPIASGEGKSWHHLHQTFISNTMHLFRRHRVSAVTVPPQQQQITQTLQPCCRTRLESQYKRAGYRVLRKRQPRPDSLPGNDRPDRKSPAHHQHEYPYSLVDAQAKIVRYNRYRLQLRGYRCAAPGLAARGSHHKSAARNWSV